MGEEKYHRSVGYMWDEEWRRPVKGEGVCGTWDWNEIPPMEKYKYAKHKWNAKNDEGDTIGVRQAKEPDGFSGTFG